MEFLFLIKKAVTFFIEPLGLILTLAFIGLYFLYKSHHLKAKFFLSVSILLLVVFSYPPIANNLIKQLEKQNKKHVPSDHINYVHVLGGGHHENEHWPLSSQIGNSSLKRTFEGISIYKQSGNPKPKLIFTGFSGFDNNIPNAKINASIAELAGVPSKNIIVNGNPKDTQEEANFARSIVGNKPFILVTSASHMPRAIKLFKNMNISPIAAPTDFKGRNEPLFSAPNIGSFEKSRNAIHEFLGISWAYLISQLN
ncbi:MAG: YdcF family protein [Candidatus Thioglobus sp.]|nr:YdcF family protein [Candidatus Thioglobus sp.]MBL6984926.1 YdcF family protein [Candidatus Thioglobus sp.]